MRKISIFLLLISIFSFGQKFTKTELSIINSGDLNTAFPVYNVADSLQHQTLLAKSIDVDPKNSGTKILVDRMKLALVATQSGVGIAAPQVGINRNVIWAKRFDKAEKPLEYFLNPKILWRSEVLNLGPEGDLSIDIFRDQFYRSQVIQLEYFTLEGKKITEIVEGFTAVILQHEIDHLSGILISDKILQQNLRSFEKVDFYKEIK